MTDSSPFLSLLLITGLAAFVPLLASRLRRLRLPTVDALVMGLRRKKEILVPRGYTKLRLGDLVMPAGKQDSLKRAAARLSAPSR